MEDRRSVTDECSVILLRKKCLRTSRYRNRTGRLVIYLKAFQKNCVLEEVSRLFWSLSKYFWKDQTHRFLAHSRVLHSCTVIRVISGKVYNDVMELNSLEESARNNPPDYIGLVQKLDLDDQTIIFIMIMFFLRTILAIN